jgi:probable rRNA maturation factor
VRPANLKSLICISIFNPSGQRLPFSNRFVENIVKKMFHHKKVKRAYISISFVSDRAIQQLNTRYLAKKKPTDVLAFDLGVCGGYLSADIVVSIDRARAVACELKISFTQELCRYIIHGVLHILGYNDHSVLEKKRMWKKQEAVLKNIF